MIIALIHELFLKLLFLFRFIEEMTRVLKPGGKLVVATWCQRPETPSTPFNTEVSTKISTFLFIPYFNWSFYFILVLCIAFKERKLLAFLYSEWTHPYFISIPDYASLMHNTSHLVDIRTADWSIQTLPSWRHSIWVGVWDPRPVLSRYVSDRILR